jgi:hypothetical protein
MTIGPRLCLMTALAASCAGTVQEAQVGVETPRSHADDELEPVQSVFTDASPGYRAKLRAVLLDAEARRSDLDYYLQCLTEPSFESESLLAVCSDKDGCYAVVRVPDCHLYVDTRPAGQVQVSERKKAIPSAMAERVRWLWQAMLANTRYPARPGQHLDGTSSVFLSWERGWGTRVARCISPRVGTRRADLVSVAASLARYVDASADAETAALQEVTSALDKLEKTLAKDRQTGRGDQDR